MASYSKKKLEDIIRNNLGKIKNLMNIIVIFIVRDRIIRRNILTYLLYFSMCIGMNIVIPLGWSFIVWGLIIGMTFWLGSIHIFIISTLDD